MEDHRDAYFYWKELGLRDHACIHIDAHLDVSNLKAPGYVLAQCPEINCGNFLLPALHEGILSSLVWVIPLHLPGDESLLDWTRLELQNWLRLDLSDYMSLRCVDERVEGTLLGKPFTVCFSDQLPHLKAPHVLDIDIDYFLDPDDNLWQSPPELAGHLLQLEPAATTIAYSVQGGYTPLRHRHLGPLMRMSLHDPDQADEVWTELHHDGADDDVPSHRPDWTRPARLAQLGRFEEAARIDPAYRLSAIDRVSAALMREKYEEARSHLREVENSTEREFMQGMIAFRMRRFKLALESWSDLLGQGLEPDTQVFLLIQCARAYLETSQFQLAYETLRQAGELARNDSEILQLQARACQGLEDYDQAARLYRRAVKVAPRLLETSQVRLELAQLYIQNGQTGLARRLLRQTLTDDTPGFMKLRAEALTLRLALGTTV